MKIYTRKGDKGETGFKGEPSTVAGPQGTQGPVGSKGDKGEVGGAGAKGETGNEGYPAGLVYNYETGSVAGSGELRLDNQNPLAATQRIDINGTDKYGNNVSNYLASWDNSTTSSTRGFITIIGFDSTTVDWTELGIFENNSLINEKTPTYVAGFDLGVLPIGD